MALSVKARKRLEVAMARRQEALEVIAAIDSNGSGPAAAVAVIGATADMTAAVVAATTIVNSNLTAVSAPDPTKAEVDAGIDTLRDATVTALDLKADNADLETLRTEAEARLDVIEGKIDAVIAALKAASMMSP